MLKTVKFVLIVATLAVAIIFAILNSETVPFHYLVGIGEIQLYILLFIFFLSGLAFALSLDCWVMWRQRQRIRRLRQQVDVAQSELNNLRKQPLKDLNG